MNTKNIIKLIENAEELLAISREYIEEDNFGDAEGSLDEAIELVSNAMQKVSEVQYGDIEDE